MVRKGIRAGSRREPTLAELLGDMRRQSVRLLKLNLALLKAEYRETFGLLTRDALILMIGASCLWISLLTLVTALIIILAFLVPLWLAVVLISLAFGVMGGGLVITGLRLLKQRSLAPTRAIQVGRENWRVFKDLV